MRPKEMIDAQLQAERKLRVQEVETGLANLHKRVQAQADFTEDTARAVAAQLDAVNTKYKGHPISDRGFRSNGTDTADRVP